MQKKILRQLIKMSMRVLYGFLIQLAFCTVLLANTSKAQRKTIEEVRVDVRLQDRTLGAIMKDLERKTDFRFTFDTNGVNTDQQMASDNFSGTVYELLVILSRQSGLSFTQINSNIHVSENESRKEVAIKEAAEITVKGKVVDESGLALPGLTVKIESSGRGTVTDLDGNYQITAEEGDVLIFSFIGFETQRVQIGNQTTIDVVMKEDTQALEEVVVVGYGTVKKSDLTGSVVSLKSDEQNQGVNTSVDQLLKGKAAGVNVVQNSSEPGGGISISIRGASSVNAGTGPLYVIDGLPIDNSSMTAGSGGNYPDSRTPTNPLAAINPNDIESIEILKDASATAIYGARGANGVIMVTTKKGKSGQMRINYDGYVGVQHVANRLDVLSAEEYQTVMNGIIADGGGIADQEVDVIEDGGTDWQDELFRTSAPVTNQNLSFSGGNEKTNYFAALNYFNQQGVVKSSAFERYSARLNLETKFSDRLTVGLNMNTSFSENDQVPAQSFGVNENNGALYAAYNFDPTLSIYGEDGRYRISPYISIDNPLALAFGKNAMIERYRNMAVTYANYKILPEWSVKVNFGTDVTNQRKDVYIDRSTKDGLANGGIATILQERQSNYLMEFTTTYDKTFNDHHLTAVAGVTTQKFSMANTQSHGKSFPSDATGTDNIGLGDPTQFNINSFKATNRLLSYLGRVNYTLKDKYLFTGTLRIDGSSRFGENNKYGYFPSGAFAWKVKEESFMQDLEALSTFKFRASWGQTGNQEIGNYLSISTFVPGPDAVFNDQKVSTTQPARIPNPDLKWETTEQWDIGLDFGLFRDRVFGSLDYFSKKTFDMLLYLPIPTSTGYTNRITNIGSVKNSGIEAAITSVNFDGDFTWTTTLNLATVKNEVTSLGGVGQIIGGSAGFANQIWIIKEGLPMYSFYGYQVDGVWQEGDDFDQTTDNVAPGDLKFRDIDGDQTVNADDREVLGNSFPDLTYSLANTFEYKGFSLYVFLEGVHGISMLNNNLVDTYFPINFRRNKFAEPYLNRWTPENPSNEYPSFVNPTAQGQKEVNSYTVQDASYLRLNTVTLNYTIPMQSNTFRNAQVYVTGTNLLTITKYDGVDPAVNPNGNANIRIDYNAYPTAMSFLLGVKLGF
ncbi:TonB-linked outer membrane protein, SusC/RagA family [Echinicola vietnamensis DSM 17526]|uniref:TonB-linked outer membrane protein, SusC/RagA family n=2 Tax=Echinicola TaxID=390846 RepID=L0G3B3_ECHVK|nr:TonB-linked outer membrane protein, SusC/RagA family [Echinicola vietnamensis DSM 17526]